MGGTGKLDSKLTYNRPAFSAVFPFLSNEQLLDAIGVYLSFSLSGLLWVRFGSGSSAIRGSSMGN
jgi:hypothetical protein